MHLVAYELAMMMVELLVTTTVALMAVMTVGL